MPTRGVRGATTVSSNQPQAIWDATQALLREMVANNAIATEDIAAAYFTVTSDLDSAFPARAARMMGWSEVPLMDALEVPVPGSLPMCIRVLLLWNTSSLQRDIVHSYQRGAQALRPDLVNGQSCPSEKENRS